MSACAPHTEWIDQQLAAGRNAVSIYQDLVEQHGFQHGYNSVKRFVGKRKARYPKRFDVLEYPPGEDAQVEFGKGALTLKNGLYRRPWLPPVHGETCLRPSLPLTGQHQRRSSTASPLRLGLGSDADDQYILWSGDSDVLARARATPLPRHLR